MPALLLGILLHTLAPSAAWAQAAIEVTVYEQGTLRPLEGVGVQLLNAEIGIEARTQTDPLGKARFEALSTAGSYTVHVEESALFLGASSEPLSLRSAFRRSVGLALVARPHATETVTVTAGGSTARVNAIDAEVSSSLDMEEIQTLAVEGRDLTRALYRLPNVTQATGFYPEAPSVSVNGANALYANYMIDGLDNNENFLGGQKFAIPTGFTQQVTVLTNSYSAEFGRTGNGIFNVTSRSGGGQLHGEAFSLTRPGPVIDAQSPFAQRDLSGNAVKDGFRRHQAGGALGGPLARDTTYFFLNAEYTRDRKDNLLRVPELGVNESVRGHNEFAYLSGKLDHRWNGGWTSSLRLNAGRVSIERQGGGLEGGVSFPSAGSVQDRNSLLAAAKALYAGRNVVAETTLLYSRFRWNYGRPPGGDGPQATVLSPAGETLAVLGHPGFAFDEIENMLQAQHKLGFRRGNHALKVGFDLISADFVLTGGGNPSGNYTVELTQAQVDALRLSGKGASLDVGDVPADARVLDYAVELSPRAFGRRQNLLGVYAEDRFAATSRLNLTLGLRYDYDSLTRGGAASGDQNNLAVRTAVNYQIGERSAIRGGYGIFYEKVLYAVYSDALQQNSTATGFRSQLAALRERGGLPAGADLDSIVFDGNLTANIPGVAYLMGPSPSELQGLRESIQSNERRVLNPEGYPNPRTQQVSAGYQRQFGRSHLVYADLVHARSDGLPRLRDLNAPAAYAVGPDRVVVRSPAEADATRPVPSVPGGARSIVVTENAGKARYDAANLSLIKERGAARYAYRMSYTLSRLRNDTDDINFRAQDANDFSAEFGPSINDRRHVVSAVAWADPLPRLSMSLAALLQSGQPINRIPDAGIFGTTDLNGDGRSFADAYLGNSDRWPGARRNDERLPWSYQFDLAVQYVIPAGPGRGLELRADVFNLFNHRNLSGYSNSATQSNQIQIGPPGGPIVAKNSGAPRQFQFGVRYTF